MMMIIVCERHFAADGVTYTSKCFRVFSERYLLHQHSQSQEEKYLTTLLYQLLEIIQIISYYNLPGKGREKADAGDWEMMTVIY